jgi:hypothetical protein
MDSAYTIYRLSRDGEPVTEVSSPGSPLLALVSFVDEQMGQGGSAYTLDAVAKHRVATATATCHGPEARVVTFVAVVREPVEQPQRPGSERSAVVTPSIMKSGGGPEALVVQYLNALGLADADVEGAFLAMTAVAGREVSASLPLTKDEAEAAIPALKRTLSMVEQGYDWMDFFAFVRREKLKLGSRSEQASAFKRWQRQGEPVAGGVR